MLNVLYEPFPDSVRADGRTYPVQTDFRVWLRLSDQLADRNLSPEQTAAALLRVFRSPVRQFPESLLDAVFAFLGAEDLYYHDDEDPENPEELPEKIPPGGPPLFDWKFDSRFILGDFLRFYQLDLLTVDFLHWFAFRALFDALPEDSLCMKRIAWRSADLSQIRNHDEKRRILKLKRAVAIPFTLSDEEIGAAFF